MYEHEVVRLTTRFLLDAKSPDASGITLRTSIAWQDEPDRGAAMGGACC